MKLFPAFVVGTGKCGDNAQWSKFLSIVRSSILLVLLCVTASACASQTPAPTPQPSPGITVTTPAPPTQAATTDRHAYCDSGRDADRDVHIRSSTNVAALPRRPLCPRQGLVAHQPGRRRGRTTDRGRAVDLQPGEGDWRMNYLSTPVQISPDGRWITFLGQNARVLVNVTTRTQRGIPMPHAVSPVGDWSPDSCYFAYH